MSQVELKGSDFLLSLCFGYIVALPQRVSNYWPTMMMQHDVEEIMHTEILSEKN